MKYILSFLFFLFAGREAHGQLPTTQWFSSRQVGCSGTVILDSTGIFFNIRICGDTTFFSSGRYLTGKQNIIRFQSLPFDSMAPINRVTTEKIIMEFDSLLTVTFYDRYGGPLVFNKAVRLIDGNNRIQEAQTNESGQVEVNRFVYQRIYLEPLRSVYGEAAVIELARESLNVYLNLPSIFLVARKVKCRNMQTESLQLRKGGLYRPGVKKERYKRQTH